MLAIDIILIFLTTACILYCMLLNRRIIQIQKYRHQMLKLFKEFDKSVVKAESILDETKSVVPESSKILNSLQKKAEAQSDELGSILTKGDKLAEELETIIISGNRLVAKFNEIGVSLQKENQNSSEQIHEQSPNDFELSDPRQSELEINNLAQHNKTTLSQKDYYQIIQNKNRILETNEN